MSAEQAKPAGRPSASLRDSLELVVPGLDPALVNADAVRWLRSVADVLPPVHRAGFECRLEAGDDTVDLQQGIFAGEAEPLRLARELAERGPTNAAWEQVRQLAQRWGRDEDHLHRFLSELWLELDAPQQQNATLTLDDARPSVFAVLEHAGTEALPVALDLLRLLAPGGQSAELETALTRLSQACPSPACISHLGIMLGREPPALRAHLSRLPLTRIDSYLERVGWQGDRQQVVSLAALLLEYGDWLVVCLDVLHDHVVRVGLECFFANKSGLDPRWRPLLSRLVGIGICDAAKAEALLSWPATITPLDSPRSWPDDLIAQSLAQPADAFGVFERRLSHVKLSFTPGLPSNAKAYFGYGHVLTRATPPASPRPATRPAATVGSAVEAAVDWLLAARNQSGWWRDFAAMPGVGFSDEWVSAYVGDALARIPLPRAREAANGAMDLLLERRTAADAWGFNVQLPVDGDATTWVLRLARSLDRDVSTRIEAARRVHAELTTAAGGVISYRPCDAPEVDRIMLVGGSYDGWCSPHLCITAPAGRLDLCAATLGYLRKRQQADGSWPSYWWCDDAYATTWAIEALASSARGGDRTLEAAVGWCAARVGDDGGVRALDDDMASAFLTGLALYGLRAGAMVDERAEVAAARAQKWLLERQLSDGSWEASARLRVPAPSVHVPSSTPELILGQIVDASVWTTATVLVALSADSAGHR